MKHLAVLLLCLGVIGCAYDMPDKSDELHSEWRNHHWKQYDNKNVKLPGDLVLTTGEVFTVTTSSGHPGSFTPMPMKDGRTLIRSGYYNYRVDPEATDFSFTVKEPGQVEYNHKKEEMKK